MPFIYPAHGLKKSILSHAQRFKSFELNHDRQLQCQDETDVDQDVSTSITNDQGGGKRLCCPNKMRINTGYTWPLATASEEK